MSKEMYEVLEVKDKPGLTVGSNVLNPGQKFSREDWPYPQLNLDAAIKNKMCKKVGTSEKKQTPEDKEAKKLEGMKTAYDKMNPKDPKAIKLLEKIKELEV